MKHFLLVLTLTAGLVIPATSQAADEQAPRGWLHHHERPHGPVIDNTARRDGTAVYGWSSRTPNVGRGTVYGWRSCGDYHYWDGGQCVDARHTPPNSP
jgi:hypothetical protein